MERIVIKNFGGITELDIELKPINLFIGKQASGKSVTVKLVYFFKTVFATLFRSASRKELLRDCAGDLLETFERYFPRYTWTAERFEVTYFWNQAYIRISNKDSANVLISESILQQFSHAQDLIEQSHQSDFFVGYDAQSPEVQAFKTFLFDLQQNFDAQAGRSVIFIPAGRSFFAFLEKSIFTLLELNSPVEPFIQQFGSMYESSKSSVFLLEELRTSKQLQSFLVQSSTKILGAEVFRKDGKEYLRHQDNRIVEIVHASSGQQELLPLLIMLRSIPLREWNGGGVSTIIEEPEAHIFPSTQREIVELMSIVFNKSPQPVQYLITTHSPYILTAFNNLMQAGMLAEDESVNKEKLYAIVPQEQVLKRDVVAAFEMSNGTAKSIIDEETGLIYADYLDEVSTETAQQFDNLLDLMP